VFLVAPQCTPTFLNYENRALTSPSFRPKVKTANRDEPAAHTSRPILIVGVVCSVYFNFFIVHRQQFVNCPTKDASENDCSKC
jgi:hypothetical protein